MKIAIIGAGFYGCFLAKEFLKNNIVHIYEKECEIFPKQSAILNNQHRLHNGFHYPRSFETIEQAIRCYIPFFDEFKKYCYIPNNNIYLIHKNSKVNFDEYLKIYKNYNICFEEINLDKIKKLKNKEQFDGAIRVGEGIIDTHEIKKFFEKIIYKNSNLKIFFNKTINECDIEKMKDQYDVLLNCSYNHCNIGLKKKFNIKHELCSLLLIKNFSSKNDAYTIMDGEFVSIYPTLLNYHTISSVTETPFLKSKSVDIKMTYQDLYNHYIEHNVKERIIEHTKKFIEFKEDDVFGQYLTIKTKFNNDVKDRRRNTLIKTEDNYSSVLCGKISAVYDVLSEIKKQFNL